MQETNYVYDPQQEMLMNLLLSQYHRGKGMYLLMQGPPGSGKTFFAETFARISGLHLHEVTGSEITVPKDAFYRYNIPKMAQGIGAFEQTDLWRATIESRYKPTAFLFDEYDKTPSTLDGKFLQLLDTKRCFFEDPYGEKVEGNADNLFVFFTTNGERSFSTALCRRMQTVEFPPPDFQKFRTILHANGFVQPEGLVNYVTKLALEFRNVIKKQDFWPTPPEAMRLIENVMQVDGNADMYNALVRYNFSKNLAPEAWNAIMQSIKGRIGNPGAALKTERA